MANLFSLSTPNTMSRYAALLPGGTSTQLSEQSQPSNSLSEDRSFASVLQRTGGVNSTGGSGGSAPSVEPSATSGAHLEQLRVNLMERLQQLPEASMLSSKLGNLLVDSKSKISLLREAMQGVGNKSTASDWRGRFGQMESEWYEVERIMKSDKTLSTGELLGLQARLYHVAQQIEVMSKVVDQATGGIKTVLNTNV